MYIDVWNIYSTLYSEASTSFGCGLTKGRKVSSESLVIQNHAYWLLASVSYQIFANPERSWQKNIANTSSYPESIGSDFWGEVSSMD